MPATRAGMTEVGDARNAAVMICVAWPERFKCQTARSPEGQGFAFPGAASRSRCVSARGFAFLALLIATNARRLRGEGAGNAGRAMHPQPRVRNKKAHERSHHGHTGNTRHSPRNGFTAYSVLSPVTGLFCHRRLARLHAKLDASVGASGPHGFAVRSRRASSKSAAASIASRTQRS